MRRSRKISELARSSVRADLRAKEQSEGSRLVRKKSEFCYQEEKHE